MKTGIVIINWNSYDDSAECLRTLLEHEPADVMVIDNGSSDGSIARLQEHFRSVRFHLAGKNLGFAGGSNIGIKAFFDEGYDNVFLLNNDTIVKEPFLKHLESLCQDDETIGVLGPVVVYADQPTRIQAYGGRINMWTGHHKYNCNGYVLSRDYGLREVDYLLGAAFMIPRRTYERIGGLDESYFPAYVEEADYCYRARQAGLRCVVTDTIAIWHKGSRSAGSLRKAFERLMRNKWLFARKYGKPYHWPVFIAIWLGHYIWRTWIRPFPV